MGAVGAALRGGLGVAGGGGRGLRAALRGPCAFKAGLAARRLAVSSRLWARPPPPRRSLAPPAPVALEARQPSRKADVPARRSSASWSSASLAHRRAHGAACQPDERRGVAAAGRALARRLRLLRVRRASCRPSPTPADGRDRHPHPRRRHHPHPPVHRTRTPGKNATLSAWGQTGRASTFGDGLVDHCPTARSTRTATTATGSRPRVSVYEWTGRRPQRRSRRSSRATSARSSFDADRSAFTFAVVPEGTDVPPPDSIPTLDNLSDVARIVQARRRRPPRVVPSPELHRPPVRRRQPPRRTTAHARRP